MNDVVQKYGLAVIEKHKPWTWETKGKKRDGSHWVPTYFYANGEQTRESIWEEYVDGLDGCLSVTKLNEIWNAKWRRGGQASENSRRNKFYRLVKELLEKPKWDKAKVFGFFNASYPISSSSTNPNLRTTSSFIRYLAMDNGIFYQIVLSDASSFFS
jgi:hypothetical protein